jgi:RimJ/RimL family protein N-acetyltransferase
MLCDINVLYFLSGFLPVLGLMLLGYINPPLVKDELVNKLNIYSIILVLVFIGVFPIIVGIYVYEPSYFLKFFLPTLIIIRFIFVLVIFISIMKYLFNMPWTKDNWIKFGVLFFSILLFGTLFNTTGKLLSYTFSCMNMEDPLLKTRSPINIYTELEKVDWDKLEIGKGLSSEDLTVINFKWPKPSISDYQVPYKRSLYDILPSFLKANQEWIKFKNETSFYKMQLEGKLPKISLLYGFIQLDFNRKIVMSPLLTDTQLFDFSPINFDNIKYFSRSAGVTYPMVYEKYGLLHFDVQLNKRFIQVRYFPEDKEGFYVINYNGRKEVFDFKINNQYEGSNFGNKFWYTDKTITEYKRYPDINRFPYIDKIILDLSLLQYKYLLYTANENYSLFKIPYYNNANNTLNNEYTSILISVPYSFEVDNLYKKPLITNRLIIRPLYKELDYEAYSLLNEDYKAMWYTSLIYGHNLSLSFSSNDEDYYNLKAGVFLKNLEGNEGKLIGIMSSYVNIVKIPGIYYQFAKEYWSQGYGSEALGAFLDYFFSLPSRELNVEGYYSYLDIQDNNKAIKLINTSTFSFNYRSRNLLQKFGFKLDYLEKSKWNVEDNITTRKVQKLGFDLLKHDGQELYKKLLKYMENIDLKRLRDYDINVYWWIITKDDWFLSNWYLLRKDHLSRRDVNTFHWTLFEDDFNKNKS